MSAHAAAPAPPRLQPPGAGLPWWELLVARYILFPRAVRRMDWAMAARLFQREGEKVLARWDACSPDQLTVPTLIPRISGIEDSSRFWSVAMTVEHLNIVGFGVLEIIAGLRQGRTFERAPRVQDVKPRGEQPPAETRANFVRLLSDAANASAERPILPGEGPCAPHPWFGPMDAHRWHCLNGIHQRIHRQQIEAIRDRLPGGSAPHP